MVYLTARTANHLYKSPSSFDLTSANGGPKSLVSTGGYGSSAGGKYHSLLSCSPSVRFNGKCSNSNNFNNIDSRHYGSSWTLNTRGHGINTSGGGHKFEYSQSKSTLDLRWIGNSHNGNNMSIPAKPRPLQNGSSTLNLKPSKSLFNIRQATYSVPNSKPKLKQKQSQPQQAKQYILPALNYSLTKQSDSHEWRTEEQIAKAKQKASILWLIAKASDTGRLPDDLRDPFYRDHNGFESLKPWITQRLANGELYGRALANIYGVPDYSCLGHQGILQLLTRRGVYVQEMGALDEPITETLLLKTSPVKLNAHMIIIECILTLYVREILIPVKVGEVVSRFSGEYEETTEADLPPSSEPEDVALFWVNRACAQLNQEIRECHVAMNDDDASQMDPEEASPAVPSLDELSDMCDGCSLFGLLAFYCPTYLDWREIVLKADISIADSIYNLQRVYAFTMERFPSEVCFLTLEDFLYLPEPLVPNFLAFIADLLFLFEIQPIECVTAPYLRLTEGYGDEFQPNYPQLPTPSEMKARSLKHQGWTDSLEMSPGESSFYNHPSTHQLYNERRNSLYKSGSNMALNQTSRRNSLSANNNNNGSRILHRRSSIVSNGSEAHPPGILNQGDLEETYANGAMVGRHLYHHGGMEMDSENGMGVDSTGQLSSYFSTLSIPNNRSAGQLPIAVSAEEYYKANRNRASSGHLTDYFSNLTAAGSPSQPEAVYPNSNRMNTHIRAKAAHPNNTDNVKALLGHHDHLHHHHHSAFTNAANVDGSQTTSSETSSIAEMSEYSEALRAMSEKRKQIELGRQHDREKRASVDQNFRQEVLRTLKGIHHHSGTDSNESDFDASENGPKLIDTVNNNNNNNSNAMDDENLTFEIHELNPIRREKTFTSLGSSKSLNNSSSSMRKNLFHASEDLKASMTDLNYSNAKVSSAKSRLGTEDDFSASSKNTSSKSNEKLDSTFEEKKYRPNATSSPIEPIISASSSQANQMQPMAVHKAESNEPSAMTPVPNHMAPTMTSPTSTVNTTPRRSQWGQPMVPLAGHYPGQPPSWSQAPSGHPYAEWYGGQPAGYPPQHHPGQQYPYPPYGIAPPPGAAPPPMARPYSMHMDPSQYGVPPYGTSEPYISMGYMQQQPQHQQQPNVPTPPSAPGNTNSLYSSSPVLNSAQIPLTQQQMSPSAAGTFRVQKNGPYPTQNGVTSADLSNTQRPESATLNYNSVNHQVNNSVDNSFGGTNNLDEALYGQQQQQQPLAGSTATTPSSEKHNEAFFISFSDQRPANRSANKQTVNRSQASKQAPKHDLLSPEKQPLTRTATQTLVSRASQEETPDKESTPPPPTKPAKSQDPEVIQQLYEVKRPVAPPGVAFVIGVQETDASAAVEVQVNGSATISENQDLNEESRSRDATEEDMTRKKEIIMKQSLRRRIEQEEKRIQKEQELAAKRESERIRQEHSDRKKEEDKAKRAFILEQYKQRKQMEEEIEKNGGPLPVSRSSSTLVLNRQTPQSGPGTTMRPSRLVSAGRPRPKSLHSTLIGLDGNPSGQSGRMSSSRDELDFAGRLSNASRPQSALSSQVSSAVTTPTHGGPFGDAFGEQYALNSGGPTSSNFYEYNGPKLFVKPSQKSNKTLILNAINVVLAGAVNAETNRRVAEVINSCDSKYYLILFRNSGLQYRAIYSYYPEREEVTKLHGIGPRSVNNEMIDKFYKYNSGTKAFTAIQTRHLSVVIDALTIQNNLWMTKKQQQQQQMTPRRFI